ncbi:MAG: aspartate-semialdehyde dehydrogenase [Bacteroidota bacterium]
MNFNVGILGATGAVGQKFIRLLHNHPWFTVTMVGASENSAGRPYGTTTQWLEDIEIPTRIAQLTVQPCTPHLFSEVDFVFSGLDSSVAGQIEKSFAQAGIPVVSNAKNYRTDPTVPLMIPEINPDHTALIEQQTFDPRGRGWIVTNPNCVVVPLASTLRPLLDAYTVQEVDVTSLQAISGAGYPGVASLDILGNVDPYIEGEEDKVVSEPLKILASLRDEPILKEPSLSIHATAVRVPTVDGHLLSVAVRLDSQVDAEAIKTLYRDWASPLADHALPSSPGSFFHVYDHPHHPQPRLHAWREEGMQIGVGRIRASQTQPNVLQYITMAHNTVRGAAGGAILNAELLVQKGNLNPSQQ